MKQHKLISHDRQSKSLKTTETLLGIETKFATKGTDNVGSLKTTETLLGIETAVSDAEGEDIKSQNYWNPFRDWNRRWSRDWDSTDGLKTTETLLGIET